MNNPIKDAIGTLKLTEMHFNNPTAVAASTVRDAAQECITRLQGIEANSLQLMALYSALFALLPMGWLPHVTLTPDPERPYAAIITDEACNIAARHAGKTIEAVVNVIKARLPMGCGVAVA